ncbi:MAG: glycosyltransferase family A protein, partial [bacterium]
MKTAQFPNQSRQMGVVPLLSVVVLSYNGMDHLAECLQTIFAQDFKNFEVIVVDNGSTDGSVEYIKS